MCYSTTSVLAHTFRQVYEHVVMNEIVQATLLFSQSILPCCPWDFHLMTFQFPSKVSSLRSGSTTPLVPLLCFINSFLLSTDIAVFKNTKAVLISMYSSHQRLSCFIFSELNISQLPLAQQLDPATLFPRCVFKSLLKDTCGSSVAETITWLIFPDTNEFAFSLPAEEVWINIRMLTLSDAGHSPWDSISDAKLNSYMVWMNETAWSRCHSNARGQSVK